MLRLPISVLPFQPVQQANASCNTSGRALGDLGIGTDFNALASNALDSRCAAGWSTGATRPRAKADSILEFNLRRSRAATAAFGAEADGWLNTGNISRSGNSNW